MGTLYLVATPIGNLDDITARALHVLGKVSLIAAEDTRKTRVLLEHYKITTPVTSYHEHSGTGKLEKVLQTLEQSDVALVSDAGTPALNDPGYELVQAAIEREYKVTPIPGPSAPIAALVVSGLPTDSFLYLGYLPRKKEARRNALRAVEELPITLIFLEAPHRLISSLQDLHHILGDRSVAVARELTKMHEEIFRGKLSEALEYFTLQAPRGEFTLVLSGAPPLDQHWSKEQLHASIKDALTHGETQSEIARKISMQSGWPRREIYRIVTELKENTNSTTSEKTDELR